MGLGLQETQFPPFFFTCPFSHTMCIFASEFERVFCSLIWEEKKKKTTFEESFPNTCLFQMSAQICFICKRV